MHNTRMDSSLFTSAAYAELFIRGSRLPAEELLVGTGLSLEELSRQDYISADHMSILMANIEATGTEPGWAARAGAHLNIGTHGTLGFVALSAPTLGEALQVMAEF